MVCIDSDVLIDFLRKKPNALSSINNIIKNGEKLVTTSVNSFEVFKGASSLPNKKEHIKNFLNKFSILDFDFESSERAAQIFSMLKEQGNLIDMADIMIASMCIENQEQLLTRNTKHFERIKELSLWDI